MASEWTIRLGEAEWRRHTTGEDGLDSLRMLGSVQRGAQFGALAIDPEGRLFQVNGEHAVFIGTRKLERKVEAALARHSRPPRTAPVVTVKVLRRRTVGAA